MRIVKDGFVINFEFVVVVNHENITDSFKDNRIFFAHDECPTMKRQYIVLVFIFLNINELSKITILIFYEFFINFLYFKK